MCALFVHLGCAFRLILLRRGARAQARAVFWGMTLAGGTSAVAPLFASLIALANEKRSTLGKDNLGFLNNRLYELAATADIFNTVNQGHNRPLPDYPGYEAGDSFNACTGWGTPKAHRLFDALVALD